MKVTIVKDTRLIKAVKDGLRALPAWECRRKVLNNLEDYKVYLYGGALRDLMTNNINGSEIIINDFDWLVDDNENPRSVAKLLKGAEGLTRNRFGNVKLVMNNFAEMDIIPFSTTYLNLSQEATPPSQPITIENILLESDFTPNSVAYSLNERVLYDYKAIHAIKSKVFELINPKDYDYVVLAKIILQSDKLGFSLGPKAQAFIEDKYSPRLDKDIKEYLEYKNKSENYSRVISRLREIQQDAEEE